MCKGGRSRSRFYPSVILGIRSACSRDGLRWRRIVTAATARVVLIAAASCLAGRDSKKSAAAGCEPGAPGHYHTLLRPLLQACWFCKRYLTPDTIINSTYVQTLQPHGVILLTVWLFNSWIICKFRIFILIFALSF